MASVMSLVERSLVRLSLVSYETFDGTLAQHSACASAVPVRLSLVSYETFDGTLAQHSACAFAVPKRCASNE
jgi:hypothetical protein